MLDKFKKVLFLSLFIISPILFNPFNGDVELIKVILISVFVCLFLIIIIFFIKIDFKFDKNSKVLIYLLCGFLIFAFISSLQNGFLTSLMGSYHRSHGLIIWLSCVLFAFITPYFIKDKKFLVKLIKILIWIGFLNAIIAVIFNNIGIDDKI